MKRLILILAALVLTTAADVRANSIRDIQISVTLHKDGSASIVERWDVHADDGTEWYLLRDNLGDISISEFSVSDNGTRLSDDGRWDVDRSRSEKAGRYGINPVSNGVELCWGIGEYGDHIYEARYRMSNAVKSLLDYDMLHLQLVSPGLSSRPEHVRVSIKAEGQQLDTTNTRAWGFGYEGTVALENSEIVFESGEKFKANSSVIALLRFEKGIFSSGSAQNRHFDDVAAEASENANFSEEDPSLGGVFGTLLLVFGVPVLLAIFINRWSARNKRKKILGVTRTDDLGWGREVPFGGDLVESDYVLKYLGENKLSNALASALILRMIYNGVIIVSKEDGDKVELSFNDSKAESMSAVSIMLYNMMKSASGSDNILQSKEFSRWSSSHTKEVDQWVKLCASEAGSKMASDGYIKGKEYSASGKNEAVKLISFRNFLKDFTLIEVRSTKEAALWKEYLVFGALFGIADKVAEQLKDVDPQMFEETFGEDYGTMHRVILLNNSLSNSITNAHTSHQINTSSKGASGGYGGRSSFGGGGGFSGGGFGGGAR